MTTPGTDPTKADTPPAIPERRPYEPPRLTGKQAIERVTLFSFACNPGEPGCFIGHP